MANFLHSCHIEKINNGQLQRAAGIIERYLDQHGNTAVTSQNHRLHQYGDLRITPEQKAAALRGDRKTFWRLRQKVGDPIADVALPILENRGLNGRVANWLTGLSDDPVKLNQLGVDLMVAHVTAVTHDYDNCIGNVPGALSPQQVAEYHHIVFREHGIGNYHWLQSDGAWLFGGTLFHLPANLYRPIWCNACDFIGHGIGN